MADLQQTDGSAGAPPAGRRRPVRVIAVASGKGGVGKTNVSVNLAMALANAGQRVMLMDADLGLGNIDVLLGIRPRYNLANVLSGDCTLEQSIVDGPGGLKIIPSSSGVQAMTMLSAAEHAGLIQAFSDLSYDFDVLLIDTAAGISGSVVSFSRAAQEVMLVVCDEPASIANAYALIKLLSREHGVYRVHILANMVQGPEHGRAVFQKLVETTDRFLDVPLDYLGYIPHDDHLKEAVQRQRSVVEAYPFSKAALAFQTLADRTSKWPLPAGAAGHLEFFVERLITNPVHDAEVMP
ncbi:MAG: MinD/ParA family protein [Gammaproteobacteria bacterium]